MARQRGLRWQRRRWQRRPGGPGDLGGNGGPAFGGGIAIYFGTVTVRLSNITGNSASSKGGSGGDGGSGGKGGTGGKGAAGGNGGAGVNGRVIVYQGTPYSGTGWLRR